MKPRIEPIDPFDPTPLPVGSAAWYEGLKVLRLTKELGLPRTWEGGLASNTPHAVIQFVDEEGSEKARKRILDHWPILGMPYHLMKENVLIFPEVCLPIFENSDLEFVVFGRDT